MSRGVAPFVSRFLRVAAARRDAPAIVEDGEVLSYGALTRRAEEAAAALAARGVRPGEPVVVELPRSGRWVIDVIGCWMHGATPVPVDPSLPQNRRRRYAERARAGFARGSDPLAWIVFTSGSSGAPKGVEVEHRGVLPVLDEQIGAFHIGPTSRCLWVLSPGFDASLSDVGTALLSGAALCIESALDLEDPAALLDALLRREITHVDLPPALLPHLDPDLCPPTVETVVIGGEVADPDAVRRWATRVRLVCVYGPTEATICTSLVVCGGSWSRPSIGRPVAGAEYLLEDGELLIGGGGLARGYLDDAELTRERFVLRDGRRYFRSGDRVRCDPDGEWIFEGRMDRQRKLRGQLVAPEEIEARLEAHPSVRRAAVELEPTTTAFLETCAAFDEKALRSHLARDLPSYMMPARFHVVGRLPTTANGKLDRAALRAAPSVRDPSSDPTTSALATIVARALGIESLDPKMGFSDLGGTSLSALEVVARAEAMGLPLSAESLLRSTTLIEAARGVRDAAGDEARSVAELESEAGRLLEGLPPRRMTTASPTRTFLVTGATGSLGARVVRRLLTTTDARVVCLARPGALSAEARVERELGRLPAAAHARVEVHASDLTRPLLGLDADTHRALAERVDHVLHLAARVSVTASARMLHPANVEGTARVIHFAASGRAKRLTYASTLSVFVSTDQAEGRFTEASRPRPDAMVFGGYAQTKVAAEHLVRQAAPFLAGVHVLRYGLLTGDSSTGRGPIGSWLPRTIRGLAAIGAIPDRVDPELCFDVTPADHAASVTARLASLDTAAELAVFHVAAERPAPFAMLRDAMRDEGVTLHPMPRARFLARIAERLEALPDPDVGAACLALGRTLSTDARARHRGLDLFEATRARFDASRTLEALGAEAVCPAPSPALLRAYVRFALGASP